MLGLGLARFLPRGVRAPLIAIVEAAVSCVSTSGGPRCEGQELARDRKPLAPAPAAGSIAVVGLFATRTGLGQGSRLLAASLERQGHVVAGASTSPPFYVAARARPGISGTGATRPALSHGGDLSESPRVSAGLSFAAAACAPVGPHRRVLGVGAGDAAGKNWRPSLAFADDIWVPSSFVAGAVARALPEGECTRVSVVPHDVAAIPLGPSQTEMLRRDARRRHGFDEVVFLVGYSFAMGSNYARKNPLAAVEAFRQAFPSNASVPARLIIRCNEVEAYPSASPS